MKKAIAIVVVLGIVGVLGWAVYRKVQASQTKVRNNERGRPAAAVALAPVTKGVVRDIGIFSGTLSPKSRFEVAPKVTGRLKQILVNIGDPVKKDQLIAMLDDDELTQQAEQARAELDMAKASVEDAASAIEVARSAVEVARKEFDRLTILKQKGIASVADLDVAEAKLLSSEATLKANEAKKRVAEALVNQRDAALKAAVIRLSYAQVRAEWQEGDEKRVVGERFVDEGTLLKVNEPIVTVLEDGTMTAVIHVIERDYPKVQIGQEAVVTTDAYPLKTFSGKIVRIAPLLKESSRQARLDIEIPNSDRLLKTGMFIRAQIEFARHDDSTLIPVAALVTRSGKRGVFVADEAAGKVTFVPLTLGIISGEQAEVVEPPLSGRVVVLGQHLLEDGAAISVVEAGEGPRPVTGPDDKASEKPEGTRTGAGP